MQQGQGNSYLKFYYLLPTIVFTIDISDFLHFSFREILKMVTKIHSEIVLPVFRMNFKVNSELSFLVASHILAFLIVPLKRKRNHPKQPYKK